LRHAEVLVSVLAGFLYAGGVFAEHGLRAAEVLLKLAELLHDLLAELDGCGPGSDGGSAYGRAHALEHPAQLLEASARVVGGLAGFLKLALHAVKLRLRLVERDLPVLRPSIVIAEAFSRIAESGLQHSDFFFLLLDLFIENAALGGKGGC
jgi:hypothetical protein